MFSGVTRSSSSPGRCSSTRLSRPTSDAQPSGAGVASGRSPASPCKSTVARYPRAAPVRQACPSTDPIGAPAHGRAIVRRSLMRYVHVRSDALGAWRVQPEDHPTPLALHPRATEAEGAAARFARSEGYVVLVHDRYGRTRIGYAPTTSGVPSIG